ncbi:DUF4391 domain-containing protein [Pannonibacter phragmitetus]|uniref:Methyl-accepting chemotaxis protein n=1 Tax=Pannonibacter phragmitetus TaxID=121719 RepID=A0A0U3E796_9HYPH|nr:DUF4391 domain-containing protein [Pannonibacter phragmitetus]ALV27409.1 methyl-accepting chemotaxis protein [Pannonibacter phragmitetus]
MTAFFDYPKSAAFGRVVPKSKIYEHAGANTALKDLFVREVDQIVWRFKLAPETINLSATKAVAEVQVFGISLKTGKLDDAVLRAIDKAIPFPSIFELTWRGKRKAMAAFKRPSEADSTKWVVSEYFTTDWVPEDTARSPLPVALDLGALYERMLTALMPVEPAARLQDGEDIQTRVERIEAIRAKVREVERIKARLAREKQYNKRVAINAELRTANQELAALKSTDAVRANALSAATNK